MQLLLPEKARLPPQRAGQQWQVPLSRDELSAPAPGRRTEVHHAHPEKAQWTPEYCVSFAEIWAGESYKAAGLPKKAPVVALIHPKNPDVVYFFVEYLFAVNMHTKVVEGEFHMVGASRVLAWELPPALTAGSSGSL